MELLLEFIAGVLIIIGSIFALVATIGIVRLPDVYARMHAASKAGSVGSGLMLIAMALLADDWGTSMRAIAGVVFFLLTAPLSAHLLAKASYQVGYRMSHETVLDEMKDAD